MKNLIKDIPYYVKFVFNCEDPPRCYLTTDVDRVMKIESTFLPGLPLSAIRVGDELLFKEEFGFPETYRVTGVNVNDIQNDFRRHGGNSRDECGHSGNERDSLLSIYVMMEAV